MLEHVAKEQKPLIGKSMEDLEAFSQSLGQELFRGRQLFDWIYRKNVYNFSEMSDLPISLREKLSGIQLHPLRMVNDYVSISKQTQKFLFELESGEFIESVLMKDGKRVTVCLSTQVGCAVDCDFCATGKMGFIQNLTAGEIVDQFLQLQNIIKNKITNVVFMGMGEPLANYKNMMESIRVLNDPKGIGIGARHITVSTVGLIPGIEKIAQEDIQINLAVSLHAPDNETRSETMPVNKRYPIEELIDACKYFVDETNRRVFIEYVLLKGQNDTSTHANKLGRILKDLLCHVNLIPVNPTEEGPYRRTGYDAARRFQSDLKKFNIPSTVRMEKGIDIDAGCGQLRDRALAGQT